VVLGDQYNEGVPYYHRRWFPEEYRGASGRYSTQDFFGDLFSADAVGYWLDFWIRRTPPNELGHVDAVAFFPKSYGTFTAPPAGPTVSQVGTHLVIGGNGVAKGQMSGPSDVAFDAEGNIYVADTNNNRIEKYDAQGNFVAVAGGFGAGDVSFTQPWSMDVAPDGAVFVADTWAHRIVKLKSDLTNDKSWAGGGQVEAGGDPMKLFGPREIVVTADGNVMITDTGNSRVVEYTKDGDFVRQFGAKGSAGGPLDFSEPVGIVTGADGDIWVGDFWNKRIVHLDRDLVLKGEIAVPAWGSQAVTDRAYMALLDDGRLLVTDPTNGKVLVFAADGSAAGEYAVPPVEGQANVRPIGIASDGTSVLVADSIGNVVRKIPLGEIAP
jgi:sugar lactone lactonase YvrE